MAVDARIFTLEIVTRFGGDVVGGKEVKGPT
jgi:hypothetical protein